MDLRMCTRCRVTNDAGTLVTTPKSIAPRSRIIFSKRVFPVFRYDVTTNKITEVGICLGLIP